MTVLYVYYKVAAAQHAALAPRVRAFQAELIERHPALVCELLQRSVAADAVETWMETYRHPAALTPSLIAPLIDAIAKAATDAALPTPRHAEIFIPLS